VSLTSGDRFGIATTPVSSTAAATYTANGWFRSDTPGRSICLRLRDWSSPTAFIDTQQCAASTNSWQKLPTITRTTLAGHRLEFLVITYTPTAGDSLEIDGLTLTVTS